MSHSADALTALRRQLDDARARRGLNKTQLARAAGLGRTVVSQALSPSAAAPTKDTVCALARALRLSVDPLLAQLTTAVGEDDTDNGLGAAPGRPINDCHPLALEVHPAAPAPPSASDSSSSPAELPAYVRRPHDDALAAYVAAAANGFSQVAFLIGSSSTGKTRSCWEAIQPLAEAGWLLWHPFDPTRAEAALADIDRVGPRTVVWLNDAQHYLGAGSDSELGERVAAVIATLLADPRRGPVLILGTLWPEYADRYMALPFPGQRDPHAQVKALIANHRISVPDKFDAAAIAAARALADAGDRQLAAALRRAADGRLAQDLAGAPELLHRYQTARPAVRAVLEAAMDARRLGAGLHLPLPFLQLAAEDFLADAEYDSLSDDWFERALADLARPVHGNLAPLRRVRIRHPRRAPDASPPAPEHPGSGPVFRLADYLEQYGQRERALLCPPASFWQAAYDHITDSGDLAQLAQAALCRYRLYWAFHLQRKSGTCRPAGAGVQTYVVRMRETSGDFEGVNALVSGEADTGSVWALLWLAARREQAGDREGAVPLLKAAASAGHNGALVRLLEVSRGMGDAQEVELMARSVAESADYPRGFLPAMYLRTAKDESNGIKRSSRLAPYVGYILMEPRAATWKFADDGTATEVSVEMSIDGGPLILASSEDDSADVRSEVVEHLEVSDQPGASSDELDHGESAARRAAVLGHYDALADLFLSDKVTRDYQRIRRLLQEVAEAGGPFVLKELVDLLRKAGDEDGAKIVEWQIIERNGASAYLWLAELRLRAGRIKEAQALVRQAADGGAFPDVLFSDGMEPWLDDDAEPWLIDSITAWWPYGINPDGTPSVAW